MADIIEFIAQERLEKVCFYDIIHDIMKKHDIMYDIIVFFNIMVAQEKLSYDIIHDIIVLYMISYMISCMILSKSL